MATLGLVSAVSAGEPAGPFDERVVFREPIQNAHVRDTILVEVPVADSFLERLTAYDGSIQRSTLQDVTLVDTHVRSAFVTRAEVRASVVEHTTLTDVHVWRSDLRSVYITRALIEDGTVTDSSIDDTTLSNVDLTRVSLCNVLVRDTGRVVTSGCPQTWPREGSYVTYAVDSHTPFFGTILGRSDTAVEVRLEFHEGSWEGTCKGTSHLRHPSGEEFTEDIDRTVSFGPLMAPTPLAVGVTPASFSFLQGCDLQGLGAPAMVSAVTSEPAFPGGPIVPVHESVVERQDGYQQTAAWTVESGLVTRWSISEGGGIVAYRGHLVATDAPAP